ncbi:hypothetical protein AHAS_Ahas12G0121600 [Arachis hypogaea]
MEEAPEGADAMRAAAERARVTQGMTERDRAMPLAAEPAAAEAARATERRSNCTTERGRST